MPARRYQQRNRDGRRLGAYQQEGIELEGVDIFDSIIPSASKTRPEWDPLRSPLWSPLKLRCFVNICSVTSELGRANIVPYVTAKGAVKMMTKGLCAELARHNIQINGIGPGYIETDLNTALMNDEKFSAWVEARTPAGRWGKADELIGAAVFLASGASDFVNGHILYVDGGPTASV